MRPFRSPLREKAHLLPATTFVEGIPSNGYRKRQERKILKLVLTAAFIFSLMQLWRLSLWRQRTDILPTPATPEPAEFYSAVRTTKICTNEDRSALGYAGYIALDDDKPDNQRRSFFWLFEAQNDAQNAPVILTIGGGPGTTGLANPLFGQSHCLVAPNGTTKANPVPWSEHYNLLALDHPIGVGFSYGAGVNNSRSAAYDVYDFLQKFFRLYPNLRPNKFVVSSGSYGGIYVPHIAHVIHEENKKVAAGRGQPGAKHINLDSLMISNPLSDFEMHYRWLLQQRCYYTSIYNATQCAEFYEQLPGCLDAISYALSNSTAANRNQAEVTCAPINSGDTHGWDLQDVRLYCGGNTDDIGRCYPEFPWLEEFLNSTKTREELGIPKHVSYQALSETVFREFWAEGDLVQRAQLLYIPLLEDGIRVLHYVGYRDANCAWPGIIAFLKLLKSPFQERFLNTPDVPWPTEDVATVRAVGPGAGNFTYILVKEAGHLVEKNQPALVKSIVEHWIENKAFVEVE
ncbi:alpha/beta-hydrolase [Dacryopinax primogenitus]|uniref:carboxypeptidase C n=1 Tax=Dacryopinax primogenitus (strain DJM 731) TaxID=1858805 RepID=M5GAP5_DACPD|nr:alpha/beta-hydrolase [Dacryopinax primogenitus]EJU03037.1 alpha/beta-hydrolase [Dacryopinax primogenitus]